MPSVAQAGEPTAAQVIKAWDNKAEHETAFGYLTGLNAGFSVSNALLLNRGKSMLYCQPGKLALTAYQMDDMLVRYVADHPKLADQWVSLVMAYALIETFPCPAK